jgi:hypothetical protein
MEYSPSFDHEDTIFIGKPEQPVSSGEPARFELECRGSTATVEWRPIQFPPFCPTAAEVPA